MSASTSWSLRIVSCSAWMGLALLSHDARAAAPAPVPTQASEPEAEPTPEDLASASTSTEEPDTEAHTRLFAPRRAVFGSIDFNGYADTRDFSQLTINSFIQLSYGFEYFGFIDFVGYPWLWSTRSDDTFPDIYSEHTLSWAPVPTRVPLDVIAQWAIVNPVSLSDRLRPGVRWRISTTRGLSRVFAPLNLWLVTNIFVADLGTTTGNGNGYPFQLSHVYRWDIAPNKLQRRLYLSGFFDQNICIGPCLVDPRDSSSRVKHHRTVTEHQLGIRVVGGLHVIGELKYNDYYVPSLGFSGGLEYVVDFPPR